MQGLPLGSGAGAGMGAHAASWFTHYHADSTVLGSVRNRALARQTSWDLLSNNISLLQQLEMVVHTPCSSWHDETLPPRGVLAGNLDLLFSGLCGHQVH